MLLSGKVIGDDLSTPGRAGGEDAGIATAGQCSDGSQALPRDKACGAVCSSGGRLGDISHNRELGVPPVDVLMR